MVAVHGGVRLRDRFRDLTNANLKGSRHGDYPEATVGSGRKDLELKHKRAAEVLATIYSHSSGDLHGLGDEEGACFLYALKALVDSAVNLLDTDKKGMGQLIVRGLLRKKSSLADDSFVDTFVVFIDQRFETLARALDAKDVACACTLKVRRHVEAHDATMAALEQGVEGHPCEGKEVEGLEEHDLEPVVLWRQWKRCGGYWPPQLPDPDNVEFEGPNGTEKFTSQLHEGTQAFLREISQHILETSLPEDGEDFRVACTTGARKTRHPAGGRGDPRGDTRGDATSTGDAAKAIWDAKYIVETANRLAEMKSSVLEPVLCDFLTHEVVGDFCRSGKLCQLILRNLNPGAELSPVGHDLNNHEEAFSIVSGVLQRLGSATTSTLRRELTRGLAKTTNMASTRSWNSFSHLRGRGDPLMATMVPEEDLNISAISESNATTATGEMSTAKLLRRATMRERVGSLRGRPLLSRFGGSSPHVLESRNEADESDGTCSVVEEDLGASASSWLSTAGGGGDIGGTQTQDQVCDPNASQEAFTKKATPTPKARGLVDGEKNEFDKHVEEVALKGLADYLQSEIVEKVPFASTFLPEIWVQDRVEAIRAFARRPTNLMLVLSMLDAAKNILRAAGKKGKEEKDAKKSDNKSDNESGNPQEKIGEIVDRGGAGGGGKETERVRRRSGVRRDRGSRNSPGWRAWETRRDFFFGADLNVIWLHVGRSLLGQEAMRIMDLGDRFLRVLSLGHASVKGKIRHEGSKTLRRCSEARVDGPEQLVKVKSMSTMAILYISSQMRMLGALNNTGLGFSKTLGGTPLSWHLRSYSWVFTDVLIDKLAELKVEQAEHARDLMVASTGQVPETDEDKGGEARAKRLRWERAQFHRDVMRDITAYGSSKDLLSKVIGLWLPEVLAADKKGATGDSEDATPKLYL